LITRPNQFVEVTQPLAKPLSSRRTQRPVSLFSVWHYFGTNASLSEIIAIKENPAERVFMRV